MRVTVISLREDRGPGMKSNNPFNRMSKGLAVSIDRRGFLRRAARGTFATTALLAAGGITEVMRARPAFAFTNQCASSVGDARGAGCPGGGHWGSKWPCGPSRCCATLNGRPSGCDCHGTSSSVCINNGGHCRGNNHSDWGGTGPACWTCNSPQFGCGVGCTCVYQTTCCDCTTSNCSDPGNVCISSYTSTIVLHC